MREEVIQPSLQAKEQKILESIFAEPINEIRFATDVRISIHPRRELSMEDYILLY